MTGLARSLIVLAFGCWVNVAQALITTYDDRADWTAAVGNATVVLDPFSNDIPQRGTIVFDSGVISAVSALFVNDNSVGFGRFIMAVAGDGLFAAEFNDWVFPDPVFAFGFDFVDVIADATSVVVDDGSGPATFALFPSGGSGRSAARIGGLSGFAGFVSDRGSFDSIRFFNQQGNGTDAYVLDNLVFAERVPVPSTLALFAVGLFGFFSRVLIRQSIFSREM